MISENRRFALNKAIELANQNNNQSTPEQIVGDAEVLRLFLDGKSPEK